MPENLLERVIRLESGSPRCWFSGQRAHSWQAAGSLRRPLKNCRRRTRWTKAIDRAYSRFSDMLRQRLLWTVIGRHLTDRLLRAGWIKPIPTGTGGIFFDPNEVHAALRRVER